MHWPLFLLRMTRSSPVLTVSRMGMSGSLSRVGIEDTERKVGRGAIHTEEINRGKPMSLEPQHPEKPGGLGQASQARKNPRE